ncbi:MAG: hypothetical protein U0821_22545 [Chloroflexota bacterium]
MTRAPCNGAITVGNGKQNRSRRARGGRGGRSFKDDREAVRYYQSLARSGDETDRLRARDALARYFDESVRASGTALGRRRVQLLVAAGLLILICMIVLGLILFG